MAGLAADPHQDAVHGLAVGILNNAGESTGYGWQARQCDGYTNQDSG